MKNFLWRHKFLILIWVTVFVVGGYIGYLLFFKSTGGKNPYTIAASEKAVNDTKTAETPKNQPKKPQIGEPAQDGDLEFTVKGTACNGERTIGTNAYAQAEAEGQFCRLSITLRNTGSAPVSLSLAAQRVFVATEDSYPADEGATQNAQADQTKNYWYQQIAPDSTVSGDLLFDLNGGEEMRRAELHGAENSPGIQINLK
ncbi:MAG TPA: DUF4352 domain-containing protein [Verrucomicrobiae bacterium]|nr:DUF4352 domain-containing protein [Verrucomicrobiae bacterium]